MNLVLVGAGGHTRAECEAVRAARHRISACVDPHPRSWLTGKRFSEDPGARVGCAAIINTGAMVGHDSTVAEGVHIAPGAIVLGGVSVGACAMIGAGAILLPAATVAAAMLVSALSRNPAARAQQ